MIRYGKETVYLTTNPEGGSWLSTCQEASEGYTSVPATEKDLTADAIAEMLDQCEEDQNRHEMVGAYKSLLAILADASVTPRARRGIMTRIMEQGGLV